MSIMETKETMGLTTDEISIKTESKEEVDRSYCLSRITGR